MRIGISIVSIVIGFALALTYPAYAAGQVPELPREYIDTTYNLPTGGTTHYVNAGDDLQTAIDSAALGDVIVLEAGATFTGNFKLPDKGAGDNWIYIISSNLDQLPEGTRVTPEDSVHMPKIISPDSYFALMTMFGAHHYRIAGIEISTSSENYNLIFMGFGLNNYTGPLYEIEKADTLDELPSNITFDRIYLHSTSETNFSRTGILADGRYIAVVDSCISNFKDRADAQAIAAWYAPGPYKIVNNYLEATGENILFGGEHVPITNAVPSDIEIRNNHFFKPLYWKNDDPSYRGVDWTIKNLFELKLAQRVLLSGNILENNWIDAQSGVGILFTVRNQYSDAPWAVVQDVAFEYNIIRNSFAGFNILVEDDDALRPSQQTKRILIKNNIVEGVTRRMVNITSPDRPLLDSTISHNLFLHTGVGYQVLSLSGWPYSIRAQNFAFDDNIVTHGEYGLGLNSETALDYSFRNNVIALNSEAERYQWTKENFNKLYTIENFMADNVLDVGFTDYAGKNYRLSENSPYKNAATDGKDIGPDIDAVMAATAYAISGNPIKPKQPGIFQFLVTDFIVTHDCEEEDAGCITVLVKRIAGNSGQVTVDYATQDGTAVAGEDYVSTSGTLSWVDGDASTKIFTIQILDDSLKEYDETLSLTLNNPTGGAGLAEQNSAVLKIIDNESDVNMGLIGHWAFDDGEGVTARDSSGYNNNGALLNGPTWTTGQVGGALEFDGIDDYVDLGDRDEWEFGPTDAFSISLWIKAARTDALNSIMGRNNNTISPPSACTWNLAYAYGGADLYFGIANGKTQNVRYDIYKTATDTWYHVTIVAGAQYENIDFYVNGEFQTSPGYSSIRRTIGQLRQTDNPFRIGGEGRYFQGAIDDVRIYDRALIPAEIAELAGFRQPVTGDLNDDKRVDIFDLLIVARAFGAKPGDANWNNGIADLNSNGLVNILDLLIIARNFGAVTP